MIEAKSITKSYRSTVANNGLTLSIRAGEILGILGENGAGKSTLLSILGGMIQPDAGSVHIDGKPTVFRSPRDALKAGVSVAHQHFSLIPTFTVREQLRLAGWRSSHLPYILRARFTGHEKISEISLGERQTLEIAKSLVWNPRLLLLDEPTSILTSAEVGYLFDVARDLRSQGTSVVFVTHKLHEALELCDRIVVLRKGEAVGSLERTDGEWPKGSESRLLRYMFGSDAESNAASSVQGAPVRVTPRQLQPSGTEGCTLFHLENVSTGASHGRRALKSISLDLDNGEIGAIVGVDGQGQREMAEVCAGYVPATGEITIQGRPLPTGQAAVFSEEGVGYITDDRIGEGTIPEFSIENNLILKRQRSEPFSRHGLLRRRSIRSNANDLMCRWRIEPAKAEAPIGHLSGGNIQKVLLARELSIASSLLIANNPSQGLDARTANYVWSVLETFASQKGGVLLFTTDVDEALTHADRVAVMYEGRVSPMERVTSGSRGELERMMVGGW